MRLSEGQVKKVYEITSLKWVTDEGKDCFRKRGIKVGTLVSISEFTSYGYFLCNLLTKDDQQVKMGVSFEDAGIIEVKEINYD